MLKIIITFVPANNLNNPNVMTIIDGKKTAADIKARIAGEVAEMKQRGERAPGLAVIIVGHDGGSESYVANKIKACKECGFVGETIRFEADVTEERLLDEIERLNKDPEVDAFIVQLPLPKHIDADRVIEAIDYHKDADGFHPVNVGRLSLGLPGFRSATPAGIIDLLDAYDIETRGKNVVVLGRSNIVGKPMAMMLMDKGPRGNATVTVCHSATKDIADITRRADIIVAALGQPGFVTADMVKEGATVIDVGTTRVPDTSSPRGWRLRGDVDFENVAPKCAYITPVPGGVGPMTICSLMKNTLLARKGMLYV